MLRTLWWRSACVCVCVSLVSSDKRNAIVYLKWKKEKKNKAPTCHCFTASLCVKSFCDFSCPCVVCDADACVFVTQFSKNVRFSNGLNATFLESKQCIELCELIVCGHCKIAFYFDHFSGPCHMKWLCNRYIYIYIALFIHHTYQSNFKWDFSHGLPYIVLISTVSE